jgi:hypothetical protein
VVEGVDRFYNFITPLKKTRGRATADKEEEYLVRDTTYITRTKIYCSGIIEVVSASPSVNHYLEAIL